MNLFLRYLLIFSVPPSKSLGAFVEPATTSAAAAAGVVLC